MKKKLIIILIILFIIMLIPIPMRLKDGGSVEYKAILYKVTKVHKLNEQYKDGYENGWKISILGIELHNKTNIEVTLETKIINIDNDRMLVEVIKDIEGFVKGTSVSVNISGINKEVKEKLNVDTQVEITFNGLVDHSYPPQIYADKIEIK